MNGATESPEALYQKLLKELKPKARKSLINVKGACDQITLARGLMNYAQISRLAVENYGGPKYQTIMNNGKLKRYIVCRVNDYWQTEKASDKRKGVIPRNNHGKYPSDTLDLKTRVFIDLLSDRLEFVEARYKELREWQERFTKVNPIKVGESIGRGPSADGFIQLMDPKHDVAYIETLKDALKNLLSLTEHLGNLKISTLNGKEKLILARPAGDYVVLTPAQFDAVHWFMDVTIDAE